LFSVLVEGHVTARLRGFIDHHAWWDAKVHGRMLPAASIELDELVLGAGQADAEPSCLAEPAFAFCLVDAGDEVVAELREAGTLGGVRA
jgi:hypothetical protein